MLSVLIPTYHYNCVKLATEIHGSAIEALQSEARALQSQFTGMVHHPLNSVLPLVLVPLVVLDFLCIHPFPDGNGRMARLLTLQLLYHFDYAVGRFISLERIFEESKESYYETLEASSQGWHEGEHNIAPWLDYFWGALLRAYKEFEERVGTIERGRGAKGARVRAEILKRQLPFSITDIEEACPGISRDTVRLVLRTMKTEGLISPMGKGRGAKWMQTGNSA